MIGHRLARSVDQLGAVEHAGVAAARVIIVVLHEGGGGQDDIGHLGRLGHELLVDDGEQVLTPEPLPGEGVIGSDHHGIGVLDQQRLDGAAALERVGIAGEDGADAAHIELAHIGLFERGAGDLGFVEAPGAGIGMEGAAAAMFPCAQHGGDAQRGVHVGGAIALAREAIAQAEIGARVFAQQLGEGFDLLHRQAGDGRGPLRGFVRKM